MDIIKIILCMYLACCMAVANKREIVARDTAAVICDGKAVYSASVD